jgi:hypothetical protein
MLVRCCKAVRNLQLRCNHVRSTYGIDDYTAKRCDESDLAAGSEQELSRDISNCDLSGLAKIACGFLFLLVVKADRPCVKLWSDTV